MTSNTNRLDGMMMTKTEIDALIARLRHQKPDGRLPSADEDTAADALELLSASKPATPLADEQRSDIEWAVKLAERSAHEGDLAIARLRAMLAASPAAPSADMQDARGAWQSIPKTPPVEVMEWYGDQYSAPVLLHDGEKVLDFVARWSFVDDGWVGSLFSDGPSPSDYDFLNTKPMRWILLSDAARAASTSANVAPAATVQSGEKS
jgi:hypothetical protein